jgi:hypothetical protein
MGGRATSRAEYDLQLQDALGLSSFNCQEEYKPVFIMWLSFDVFYKQKYHYYDKMFTPKIYTNLLLWYKNFVKLNIRL